MGGKGKEIHVIIISTVIDAAMQLIIFPRVLTRGRIKSSTAAAAAPFRGSNRWFDLSIPEEVIMITFQLGGSRTDGLR